MGTLHINTTAKWYTAVSAKRQCWQRKRQKTNTKMKPFSHPLYECSSYYVMCLQPEHECSVYIIRTHTCTCIRTFVCSTHFATEPFMCIIFGFPWTFPVQTDALLASPNFCITPWGLATRTRPIRAFYRWKIQFISFPVKYCPFDTWCDAIFFEKVSVWWKSAKEVSRVRNSDPWKTSFVMVWMEDIGLCATLRYCKIWEIVVDRMHV